MKQKKSDTSERVGKRGGTLRASRRILHRVSVGFSPEPYDSDSNMTPPPMSFGLLINISQRGLCLDAPGNYHINQIISLYLRLAEDTSGITMLAKIIWMKPQINGVTRLGLQFIGTLPGDWQKMLPQNTPPPDQ